MSFIPVMLNLNFQHHYFSLQSHDLVLNKKCFIVIYYVKNS